MEAVTKIPQLRGRSIVVREEVIVRATKEKNLLRLKKVKAWAGKLGAIGRMAKIGGGGGGGGGILARMVKRKAAASAKEKESSSGIQLPMTAGASGPSGSSSSGGGGGGGAAASNSFNPKNKFVSNLHFQNKIEEKKNYERAEKKIYDQTTTSTISSSDAVLLAASSRQQLPDPHKKKGKDKKRKSKNMRNIMKSKKKQQQQKWKEKKSAQEKMERLQQHRVTTDGSSSRSSLSELHAKALSNAVPTPLLVLEQLARSAALRSDKSDEKTGGGEGKDLTDDCTAAVWCEEIFASIGILNFITLRTKSDDSKILLQMKSCLAWESTKYVERVIVWW